MEEYEYEKSQFFMTELSGLVKKGASTTTRAFPPATGGIKSALKSTIEESQESDRKPNGGG